MRKSVLLVAGYYYPSQIGGPCNSQYWLANALGKIGYNVTVTAKNFGIDATKVEFDKWINTDYGKVIYIKTKNPLFSFKYILKTILQASKNEFTILSSVFFPSIFLVGLFSFFTKTKIIWSPRGELDEPVLKHKMLIKKLMLFCLKIFKKKIIFHTTSHQETNYVKQVFGEKIKYIQIPNYMLLQKPLVGQQENTILYCGRIHAKKNIANLIEAASKSLNFINSNFVIKLIGDYDNDYGNELLLQTKRLNLEHKLQFLGYIDDIETKNKLYASAYFTIMPSITENFGNVVVESLAQGTPVIASKGTPWQILEETNAGYWIEVDVESIKNCIDTVISLNDYEYQKMRKNAFATVDNHFNIEKNIVNWDRQFQLISN